MRRIFGTLLISALLVLGGACGESTTDQVVGALTPAPGTPGVSEASSDSAANGAAPAEGAEAPAAPTMAAPESPTAPQVVATGFGQDGSQMGVAFIVENPNPGHTFESSQYQIAAYDANNTVVETESGYVTLLLPGQRAGIATTMFLNEGVTVARVDVQLKAGRAQPSEPVPTFTVDAVTYMPEEYFPKVTGTITSPYQQDLENIRVSAVAYDAAGQIIGGGFTFVDFVPAGGQAAVEVSVTTAGPPASVELYPMVSGLTLLGS